MEIRDAILEDAEAIREIARRSLLESYSELLDENTILEAVDQWFSEERITDLFNQSETVFFPLVEISDEPVAFAQCHLVDHFERIGELHWLHVTPEHRRKGIGQVLFEHIRDRYADLGIQRLKGLVFDENKTGCAFFERNGFDLAYTHEQSVAGRSYTENVYVYIPEGESWRQELEPVQTADGQEVYLAYHEASIGSEGPFHMSYLDADRNRRYGWFCSVCESFDTAMDPMGRVECNDCGNQRKATRWDAAYL